MKGVACVLGAAEDTAVQVEGSSGKLIKNWQTLHGGPFKN